MKELKRAQLKELKRGPVELFFKRDQLNGLKKRPAKWVEKIPLKVDQLNGLKGPVQKEQLHTPFLKTHSNGQIQNEIQSR